MAEKPTEYPLFILPPRLPHAAQDPRISTLQFWVSFGARAFSAQTSLAESVMTVHLVPGKRSVEAYLAAEGRPIYERTASQKTWTWGLSIRTGRSLVHGASNSGFCALTGA